MRSYSQDSVERRLHGLASLRGLAAAAPRRACVNVTDASVASTDVTLYVRVVSDSTWALSLRLRELLSRLAEALGPDSAEDLFLGVAQLWYGGCLLTPRMPFVPVGVGSAAGADSALASVTVEPLALLEQTLFLEPQTPIAGFKAAHHAGLSTAAAAGTAAAAAVCAVAALAAAIVVLRRRRRVPVGPLLARAVAQ